MPLSSIVGHSHLIELLRTAVARDRVPQSLLFSGPDGVGKRTVAIALAQAVNCRGKAAASERSSGSEIATRTERGVGAPSRERAGGPAAKPQEKPEKNDACGECATCLRIARGQHTDVSVIDRGEKASISIEVVRERIMDVAGYRPFEARRRVFIIDGADDMTPNAQDALLKTLEEPPASAMIILVSAFADTLLPTIQSRCRRLRFGLLTEADVVKVLVQAPDVKVRGADRGGLDPARARLMAAGSGGSVSRAMAEEEGDLADDRAAAVALLRAAAGKALLPKLKAAASLSQHDKSDTRRAREKLSARMTLMASLCRDVVAMHAGAASAVANTDVEETLRDLARAFPADRLTRAFGTIERAQQALDRNASPKLVSDWVGVSI